MIVKFSRMGHNSNTDRDLSDIKCFNRYWAIPRKSVLLSLLSINFYLLACCHI